MKLDEIRRRYAGEWVLIEYDRLDDHLRVVEGRVLAHSPDRDEIYRRLRELKGRKKRLAVEFLGEIPEDVAVMLSILSASVQPS